LTAVGRVYTFGMFYSDVGNNGISIGCAVRPVVYLKSGVTSSQCPKIDDKTEEIWKYGEGGK